MEDGEEKAKEENVMFIETSAKAGYNIKPLFRNLATALPGMDAAPVATESNLIDIKLNPTPAADGSKPEAVARCSC